MLINLLDKQINGGTNRVNISLKAHVHLDALRALYSRKKTFRVVEKRCLQCVESIFVNLAQFAKSGLKKKSKQVHLVFFFTSFWIFWSGIEPFCFCECLFHWRTFDASAIETYGWTSASTGVAEVHSSPCIGFLISGEMGKKLLGVNSTDTVFAEFFLHRMFSCKQRSHWNQLKAKQASQSNVNNALFNLTYEASDILNVNL